jgi:hypothetical protein
MPPRSPASSAAPLDPSGADRVRLLRDDPGEFSRAALPAPLRPYQLEVARAIGVSVQERRGDTITVLFPRQAGKNELSAQVEAWLLWRFSRAGGQLVKAAPTFRPQLLTSLHRLERMLRGPLTADRWTRRQGFIVQLDRAAIHFLSASPTASIVGATANVLLEGDEAQDLDPEKWDRDLVPMGATANTTRVLYGTPWTDDTLLARTIRENLELERRDGRRRHFQVDYQQVAALLPAYGRHVAAEIARLGASHPIVRTQYLLKELSRADRLLSAEQLQRLQGEHPPLADPVGHPWGRGTFVAGLDVAGADEEDPDGALIRVNPARDSTVLAIGYAEQAVVRGSGTSGQGSAGVVEPKLYLAHLYAWRGAPHRELYPVVLALLRRWRVTQTVVDATGVGGGLAAFLQAALPLNQIRPWLYTAASKSQLGYDLLSALNADRLKLYANSTNPDLVDQSDRRRELLAQAGAATRELRANQIMAWSVPTSQGHDDLLNALALLVQAGPLAARRVARGRPAAGRRRSLER